ncbi:conserved hypothetical protein [Theileria orientalis strain Shintoku]|uniref:Uncharacterized protein n=1 Tax=Theileria orientalis strain Shintoku TaxID=869250 RepID=J4CCV5_THEOR|nr:conserved hypothetical protein [Theileria orientalis strain Shintoku]BAM40052.1 conserved hypothetical protein [Theileria orientalis strain Shintoku]|eukprot:XP_009690353.1 conserved hypothetical protein [Theileria orientalis strain Shintoku]
MEKMCIKKGSMKKNMCKNKKDEKENAKGERDEGRPHAYRQLREPGNKIRIKNVMNRQIIYGFIYIYILGSYKNKITLSIGNTDVRGGASQKEEESGESIEITTEAGSESTGVKDTVSQKNSGVESSGANQGKITETCSQNSRKPEDESEILKDSKDFQIFTMEAGQVNAIATVEATRYDLVPLKYGFKYLFKEGALCTQVKHKHATVWAHNLDVDGTVYPKKVYFNTHMKLLVVLFDNRWYYSYNYFRGTWKYNKERSRLKGSKIILESRDYASTSEYEEEPNYTQNWNSEYRGLPGFDTKSLSSEQGTISGDSSRVEEEKFDKDQFSIYTVSTDDTATVNVNQDSQFIFETLKYGFKYTFKDAIMCVEVKHKDKTVWKHTKDTHGDQYPKLVYVSSTLMSLSVVLANNWFYSYDYTEGRWKFNYDKSEGRACEYCLDIPDDVEQIDLFDYSARYFVTRYKSRFTFSFREHTDCVRVKVGDDVVWRHDPLRHPEEFPVSVLYNSASKRLSVTYYRDLALDEEFYFEHKEGKWKPYSCPTSMSSVFHF